MESFVVAVTFMTAIHAPDYCIAAFCAGRALRMFVEFLKQI